MSTTTTNPNQEAAMFKAIATVTPHADRAGFDVSTKWSGPGLDRVDGLGYSIGNERTARRLARAIEDGELVDVTEWASASEGFHGGFVIPVALTRAAWSAIEAIPASLEGIADVRGRAHDVLWMASLAGRRANGESRVGFKVILPSKGTRTRNRVLVADIGPGDAGEPVVTIGFPEDF